MVNTTTALPRWSCLLRSGFSCTELWPCDTELVALQLGLRRLIKRETREADEAEQAEQWLRSQGLIVERYRHEGGSPVLVAAATAQEVGSALVHESRSRRARDASAAWLGRALGYPRCCIEAYLAQPQRNDAALFNARVSTLPATPAPPESQWLIGPLALVSHAPCEPRCRETLALAAAVRDELERRLPGFHQRWRAVAARVVAVDTTGRAFALRLEGSVSSNAPIEDALEILPQAARMADTLRPAPELSGRSLELVSADLDGTAAATHDRLVVRWLADHRGDGGAGQPAKVRRS